MDTLTRINKQYRDMRRRGDIPEATVQRLEQAIDETVDTMRTLVDVLIQAHQAGDLNGMASKDREEP
jgi:hypothetical protein